MKSDLSIFAAGAKVSRAGTQKKSSHANVSKGWKALGAKQKTAVGGGDIGTVTRRTHAPDGSTYESKRLESHGKTHEVSVLRRSVVGSAHSDVTC